MKTSEIKNRKHYFLNELISIEDFGLDHLKINKKSYRTIRVYYMGYIN